jgi:hypothetical protein
MQKSLNPLQVIIFPSAVPSVALVGIVAGLILVHPLHQWKEVFRHTLAQGLPWLITAFGLVWILVSHPGIELEPSLSLFPGMIAIVVGLGLRLWWMRELSQGRASSQRRSPPQWPRLLMGFGLATTTGSAVIFGASLLAGIVWWMENQSALSPQGERTKNFIAGLNPIWSEAALGIGMILLALLTFSIRSL